MLQFCRRVGPSRHCSLARSARRWAPCGGTRCGPPESALGVIIAVGAVIAMMEIGAGLEGRPAEDHRQHGRQHAHGPARARPPAAASASAPAARMTLTPAGRRRDPPPVPGRQPTWPHRPRPLAGRLRQSQLGPSSHVGTTPSYLAVRDWEDLDEGDMFTDRDVRNAQQGLRDRRDPQARAVPGRIAHRQGDPHPERLLPGDRRARAARART